MRVVSAVTVAAAAVVRQSVGRPVARRVVVVPGLLVLPVLRHSLGWTSVAQRRVSSSQPTLPATAASPAHLAQPAHLGADVVDVRHDDAATPRPAHIYTVESLHGRRRTSSKL